MNHSENTFSGFKGLKLYYQCWRPEGEPRTTLAIVHGFGEHSGRYGNVVDWFVPKGYAVYAFDLRGHGRSPGPRGYVSRWAVFREDVKAFLELVHEQEPGQAVFLLGHSMGGLIVLEYALHYPEGLTGVIASGPLLAQANMSPSLVTLSKILSGVLPWLTLDTKLDATSISRDPAVVETYVNDPLVHSLGTPRLGTELTRAIEWTQAHAAAQGQHPLGADLPEGLAALLLKDDLAAAAAVAQVHEGQAPVVPAPVHPAHERDFAARVGGPEGAAGVGLLPVVEMAQHGVYSSVG